MSSPLQTGKWLLSGLAALALVFSAHADEAETPDSGAFEVDFTIVAVSDYRFRGYSLTDKGPALQPELTVSHENGLYVFAWGSNIDDNGGAGIEVDFGAGYYTEFGRFNFDLNGMYYSYPDANDDNYAEYTGRLGAAVGNSEVGFTLAYSPAQESLGDVDNTYVMLDGSVPIQGTPFTLLGSYGVEDGAFGDSKRDWSIGASTDLGPFSVSLTYVDAARTGDDPLTDPTAVFAISRSF
ncbi:MAG: hypothetical protein FP825_09650 [Hyphomonas sp.]|uniref:TorF family putative porin n=1 Tax=Hyphomonas sp. TaxID=87 RepID=UPI001794417C|nr:TorF family putative porin [Hyphomonas sp.]MBA3068734.1 hypothetical protein [Hyphomonas sp.]MBU3922094.1 TorF family putative porin [Alphaproteobacteria bacterium]MBU4063602.1 TorF family putative porin [Alphaproteobacteria bacterium]MBU4165773.1 TorF family putative porin [Alphaproteobacteria bacterium]